MREQLRTLQAETDVPITSTADGAAVDLLLARIAADIDHAPKAAVLDLGEHGTVSFAASETGEALDQSNARAAVDRALIEGRASADLPTRLLPPAIPTEQVADAHQRLLRMLDDPRPIQLSAAEKTWTVERPSCSAWSR